MARGNSSFSQVTVCESMEFVADDDLQEEEEEEEEEEEGNDKNIGERCGICMDVVIDRGVLDCCQHWFCFSCIDNWATITNLCPLCQNEFQLITCVPVYDTIGSNNVDEDLQLRDDDWRIEGKNNTLSFPSYYIDENAVVCLEGDGCKVRSMSASIEEYSNLDTSIACDSCDIWYHAFCVGFDAEGTCENSWLCPRCTVTIMQQKSDEVLLPMPSNQNVSENSGGECLVDAALAGKVVVSVADAGETAVVVSMLEEKQGTEEENQAIMSHLEVHNDPKFGSVETLLVKENEEIKLSMLEAPCQMSDPVADALGKSASEVSEGTEEERRKFLSFSLPEDLKMDPSLPSSFPNNHNLENDRLSIEPNSMAEELQLSLSQGSSVVLPTNSLFSKSETISVDKEISTASLSIAFETSSSQLLDQLHNKEALVSGMDLHLGLSVSSSLSVHKTKLTEDQVQQINNLKESLLLADDAVVDRKNNDDVICGTKRKTRDWRGAEDGKTEVKVAGKKVTDKGNTEMLHLRGQADESVSKAKQKTSGPIAVLKNGKGDKSGQIKVTTSIMDIVHGTENRRKRLAHPNLAGTSSGNRETAAGLRVKKIMRRPTEENESFVLVQNLRKEIRDAVRNKTSKELGGNNFDPKLLAAFRAAVVGPESESKKSLPVDLMAKKSLLRKGNVRENLTKKIYGMGGRRRRAWNRDCEIEFWKYRCSKISKPEKIETLKSVLNLLRKDPESTEIKQRNENDASSSILSRLYVADSSLFPRKEDIKPLSTLKGDSDTGQNKVVKSTEKASTSALGNNSSRTPATSRIPSQIKIPPINSAGNKQTVPVLKGGFPSSKLHSDTCSEGTSLSTLGASNSLKETNGKSDDIRTDKRKWAQQFLARKAAVAGKDTSKEQEEIGVLKVNHPLLAQLPRDMRPILAISRHNKLPTSVRQAQLYRLTEQFLRKANIPVHSRTAEIELAVADAVNIEKMVADKSNSKLVYVNLCSQELLHRSSNTSSGRAVEANPNLTSEIPTDRSVKETNDSSSSFEVVEALRKAGLLSDSPPNSPHHRLEEIEEDDNSTELVQEGPDNVFEIDSQPELDIYGDFEYDLEDEDFIGASSLKTSELQPGEPKLKMVFSTADTDRSSGAQTSEDREDPVEPDGSFNSLENLTNTITASSNNDSKKDKFDPQSSSVDDGGEEFSLAECEELYGPDREPLVTKFPESTYTGPYESIPTNLVSQNNEDNGYIHTLEASNVDKETSVQNLAFPTVVHQATVRGDELNRSQKSISGKQHDDCSSVYRKVEAYIKEHIRPLCKSGVINVEQYRWAVAKTANKIMKYHSKDKNANFLIKEGEKVKKLAEQYVEAAPRT